MASIVNGLFAGRAGIQSHGSAISVLADNIANANTIGFKAARPDFTDLLAESVGGSSGATVGNGSQVSSITQIFNQGTFEFTGRGLDVAIDGDGFFIVGEGSGRFYSRAGNFQVRSDGVLVNQTGLPVLGFPSNGSSGLQELNVNSITQANIATNSATITGNLDASSDVEAVPGGTPTFTELNDAAKFSTFVEVFDSLGESHTVTVFFFHTDDSPATWEVEAYVDAGEVGGTAGEPSQIGTATLNFDDDGQLTTGTDPVLAAAAAWSNGSAASAIDMTFDPFTQFSAPSAISSISQDGQGVGNIVSLSVEADGTLFAQLDNGLTTSIGQIALATFANNEGLRRAGNSLYVESAASGEPVVGTPDTGKFGATEAGALELSTADIADDFIKLISYQRGFQGSARIITSIDDLLSEIINLA